jgi:hypothetical protein
MSYFNTLSNAADPHLLTAIIRTAQEECAHATWEELEPVLAEAWEDLRGADEPPWDLVVDEIQKASLATATSESN